MLGVYCMFFRKGMPGEILKIPLGAAESQGNRSGAMPAGDCPDFPAGKMGLSPSPRCFMTAALVTKTLGTAAPSGLLYSRECSLRLGVKRLRNLLRESGRHFYSGTKNNPGWGADKYAMLIQFRNIIGPVSEVSELPVGRMRRLEDTCGYTTDGRVHQ